MDSLFYQFERQHNKPANHVSRHDHEAETLQLGYLENDLDFFVKNAGDKLFAFNLLASNRVGLIRPLPDTRNHRCPKHYDDVNSLDSVAVDGRDMLRLHKASIIICYYNEAPSALLRTIYSVLYRSPLDLIEEIIIVDDFSEQPFHADRMGLYVNSSLVKLVRTSKREGLIRARLVGAQQARGDILIFLDSHVEANIGWLEPLMETVVDNRTTIACPIIDLINAETMIYSASPMVKGGLDWRLQFKWDSVPSEKLRTYDDFTKPIEAPTMAGGLFAVNRDYFYQIGSYDPHMELWGGENIELSLRTWMCGGQVLILPCSRLGHIFRKRRPYGPDAGKPDSLLYNSHRAARVWLDEHIERFYEAVPKARNLDSGDVSEQVKLREKLSCRNFTWFIDNIYPSLGRQPGANNNGPGATTTTTRRNLFRRLSQ